MADDKEKNLMPIEGQEWVVVNIVGPGLRQKVGKKSAFRILAFFPDQKEDPRLPLEQYALDYANEYKKRDNRFDIYVVRSGHFLPMLHEVHEVGNVKYDHKELNDLIDVHERTRTQTEDWNRRIENAQLTKKDGWAEMN
jgi:hypothetical protein